MEIYFYACQGLQVSWLLTCIFTSAISNFHFILDIADGNMAVYEDQQSFAGSRGSYRPSHDHPS